MNVSVTKFCALTESVPKSISHIMVNCWPAEEIYVPFARGQPTKVVGIVEVDVDIEVDKAVVDLDDAEVEDGRYCWGATVASEL